MNEYIQSLLEGRIDFEGQKVVEKLARLTLIAVTAVSFVLGFALQSLRVTFTLLGASVILLSLVVVPPWGAYNRHPVKWLPPIEKKPAVIS